MTEKIIFCPHCNQKLSLAEEYMDVEIMCPTCQHEFFMDKSIDVQCPNCPVELPETFAPRKQPEAIIREFRYKLNKFFYKEKIKRVIRKIFAHILNIIVKSDIIQANAGAVKSKDDILIFFQRIQDLDQKYLNGLDVLPSYGKTSSQLAAKPYTLFSPVVDDEVDDALYEFVDAGDEKPDILVYSLERVTKIYTFEHQLFIFQAYWDYRTATLFDESTEVFFFKDITDISTANKYENVTVISDKKENKFWGTDRIWIFLFTSLSMACGVSLIMGFATQYFSWMLFFYSIPACCFVVWFIFSAWQFIHELSSSHIIIKKIKLSETFTITASSGRSTGMTILCDEWIEANNGKFEKRTDGEKIIHAIRKMIEEKKVSVNE